MPGHVPGIYVFAQVEGVDGRDVAASGGLKPPLPPEEHIGQHGGQNYEQDGPEVTVLPFQLRHELKFMP